MYGGYGYDPYQGMAPAGPGYPAPEPYPYPSAYGPPQPPAADYYPQRPRRVLSQPPSRSRPMPMPSAMPAVPIFDQPRQQPIIIEREVAGMVNRHRGRGDHDRMHMSHASAAPRYDTRVVDDMFIPPARKTKSQLWREVSSSRMKQEPRVEAYSYPQQDQTDPMSAYSSYQGYNGGYMMPMEAMDPYGDPYGPPASHPTAYMRRKM